MTDSVPVEALTAVSQMRSKMRPSFPADILDNMVNEGSSQKCVALRDDFLVCGPMPAAEPSFGYDPDVLMPRQNILMPCYSVLTTEAGNRVEVCAPTRKDAHLRMQEIAKDGLAISKELFQMRSELAPNPRSPQDPVKKKKLLNRNFEDTS